MQPRRADVSVGADAACGRSPWFLPAPTSAKENFCGPRRATAEPDAAKVLPAARPPEPELAVPLKRPPSVSTSAPAGVECPRRSRPLQSRQPHCPPLRRSHRRPLAARCASTAACPGPSARGPRAPRRPRAPPRRKPRSAPARRSRPPPGPRARRAGPPPCSTSRRPQRDRHHAAAGTSEIPQHLPSAQYHAEGFLLAACMASSSSPVFSGRQAAAPQPPCKSTRHSSSSQGSPISTAIRLLPSTGPAPPAPGTAPPEPLP
mmetsp:Transcript_68443/g.196341  ORF Transcript_68443/g.196341 Transcript_68443/m.196341 type:complete len:261 (-) Transcript_68443:1209-1991(-)